MKPVKVLLFFLAVFAVIVGIWYVFPADGVKLGPAELRFPSYEKYLAKLSDTTVEVNVDSVLQAAQESLEALEESKDTLSYYIDYFEGDPNRICLPDGDSLFFDSVFAQMEKAVENEKTVRIVHYGDSQLEMDRISAQLRQALEERFGGSGPGMVPMIQRIHSVSVTQNSSGNLVRYTRIADSTSHKSPSHRYGPLMQYAGLEGNASFSFKSTTNRYAQPLTKRITDVSVMLGHNSAGLTLKIKCDTLEAQTTTLDSAMNSVSVVSWHFPQPVTKGTISFSGKGEIYGIMLDGGPGVTVDNVALRGSSGSIFTSIDSTVMAESFAKTDVPLIIMEFGGNAMPGISSEKGIQNFLNTMLEQFRYFRKVAPKAKIMFVGPADMCKSVNGNLVTWPLLPQFNDALKECCLSHGVAYWDTFRMMGGVGSMKNWVNHNPALAGPDYIHFTTKGANYVGETLAGSLLTYHDFYKLRKKLPAKELKEYISAHKDSLEAHKEEVQE